jgi:hypothetical protein
MNSQECVKKLNRLHQLKLKVFRIGNPYRIQQITNLLDVHLTFAQSQFEFIYLDSIDSYKKLLGETKHLQMIRYMKNEAYRQQEYEISALFRDQELYLISNLMEAKGFKPEDQYFCMNNIVFIRQ